MERSRSPANDSKRPPERNDATDPSQDEPDQPTDNTSEQPSKAQPTNADERRNTPEFHYALDSLSVEKFPTYIREFNNILTFPEKLMLMLEYTERLCSSTSQKHSTQPLHWTQCGTAFVIHDYDQFCQNWLSRFFGNTKYSSFTRKLYRWNFSKMFPGNYGYHHDINVPIFAHEYFLRDEKNILWKVASSTKKYDNQQPKCSILIDNSTKTKNSTSIEATMSVSNTNLVENVKENSAIPQSSGETHSPFPNPNPTTATASTSPLFHPPPYHHHQQQQQRYNSLVAAYLQQHNLVSSTNLSSSSSSSSSSPLLLQQNHPTLTSEELVALIAVLLLQSTASSSSSLHPPNR